MKDDAHKIIGKTIIGVIIKETMLNRPPYHQLFLIFDDHTSYEFYLDTPINPTGGVDKMSFREIDRCMGEQIKAVFHAVQAPDSGKVTYGSDNSLYRMKATPSQESVKWTN